MLVELAAFTAAAKTVTSAIQAGKELTTVASSIGKMAESKDQLHTRLHKKKNNPFVSSVESDFEEFMALEEIKQREEELLKMMVYTGRIGLKDDFIKYQAEARRQRKEAIKEAERQREARIEMITTGVLMLMSIGSVVGLFVWLYLNYG